MIPRLNRCPLRHQRIWVKKHGRVATVNKGYYLIPKGTGPEDALSMIVDGREMTFSITLVEGNTVGTALASIKNNKNLKHVLKDGFSESDLKELLKVSYRSAEGLLMPETYSFVKGETDEKLIKRAYGDMIDFLHREYAGRKKDLPYRNEYEALIMASIVEKETSVPEERARIASVFVNRLKKGMRLQTDPTVIYGVRDRYKGRTLGDFCCLLRLHHVAGTLLQKFFQTYTVNHVQRVNRSHAESCLMVYAAVPDIIFTLTVTIVIQMAVIASRI